MIPKSILEPLLLDQARRAVENHRQAMISIKGMPGEDRTNVQKAFEKLLKAKRDYEHQIGRSLEEAL